MSIEDEGGAPAIVGQVSGFEVPRYAGFTTFARLPRLEDVGRADIAVVGVPFDSGVTYRPGARFGPSHIRQSSRLLRPYHPGLQVSPFKRRQVVDAGDVTANPFSVERAIEEIASEASALIDQGMKLVAMGGDHDDRPATPSSDGAYARAGRSRSLRRSPRYLGHVLRRAVYARHSVPACQRRGADA